MSQVVIQPISCLCCAKALLTLQVVKWFHLSSWICSTWKTILIDPGTFFWTRYFLKLKWFIQLNAMNLALVLAFYFWLTLIMEHKGRFMFVCRILYWSIQPQTYNSSLQIIYSSISLYWLGFWVLCLIYDNFSLNFLAATKCWWDEKLCQFSRSWLDSFFLGTRINILCHFTFYMNKQTLSSTWL